MGIQIIPGVKAKGVLVVLTNARANFLHSGYPEPFSHMWKIRFTIR
jgi:hypothetical protein